METRYCAFCGKETHTKHHLIFGVSLRKLADQDGLWIDCCDECHNLAVKPHERIHGNSMAEKLSKMLGQAIWEQTGSREDFIKRYGRSWL